MPCQNKLSRTTTEGKSRWCPSRQPALLMLLIFTVAPGSGLVHAAPYFEPSITTSVLADDNIFISAEDQQRDVILRVSPAVETGHDSGRFSTRAYYAQDLEAYAEHSEMNSSDMRRILDLWVAYQPAEMTVYSVTGSYMESRVPAEFNIATGVGFGRIHGDRLSIAPEVNRRFSDTLKGSATYTFMKERLAGGLRSDSNGIGVALENDRSRTLQMLYDYNVVRYSFDGGVNEVVHTPRIGVYREIGPGMSVSGLVGPRFTRAGTRVDVAGLLQHEYSAGRYTIGYDRSAGTLIGEPGLVEFEALNAAVFFNLTTRLEAGLTGSYGNVSRQDSTFRDARAYRAILSTNYRFNDYASLTASYAYSRQRAELAGEQIIVPGNVAMLAVTFGMPQRTPRMRREF